MRIPSLAAEGDKIYALVFFFSLSVREEEVVVKLTCLAQTFSHLSLDRKIMGVGGEL